jgi:chromosome segregation ATPase
MSSDYDATEFIDGDLQPNKPLYSSASAGTPLQRAPSREDVASELAQKQQELAAIMRAKEEKERERAALEETRRRQSEFVTGREEMIQNLTRGVGLLEEAEFAVRRDAEQMSKALVDLRDALAKVQAIREDGWTAENFNIELTRALTTLENARMEWNTARLKFAVLSGKAPEGLEAKTPEEAQPASFLAGATFGDMCRLGLALTWPVALVVLLAMAALIALLARH